PSPPFGSSKRLAYLQSRSPIRWFVSSYSSSLQVLSSASSTSATLTDFWSPYLAAFGARTSRLGSRGPCSDGVKPSSHVRRSSKPRTVSCGGRWREHDPS